MLDEGREEYMGVVQRYWCHPIDPSLHGESVSTDLKYSVSRSRVPED